MCVSRSAAVGLTYTFYIVLGIFSCGRCQEDLPAGSIGLQGILTGRMENTYPLSATVTFYRVISTPTAPEVGDSRAALSWHRDMPS